MRFRLPLPLTGQISERGMSDESHKSVNEFEDSLCYNTLLSNTEGAIYGTIINTEFNK